MAASQIIPPVTIAQERDIRATAHPIPKLPTTCSPHVCLKSCALSFTASMGPTFRVTRTGTAR